MGMGTQSLLRKCHRSEANAHHVLDAADSMADYRFNPPTFCWDGGAFINTLTYSDNPGPYSVYWFPDKLLAGEGPPPQPSRSLRESAPRGPPHPKALPSPAARRR